MQKFPHTQLCSHLTGRNLTSDDINEYIALNDVLFLCRYLFFVFLIFYVIEEIVEISVLKKQYFKGFFNNVDYVVILMCLAILGHRAVTYFVIQPTLKNVNISASEFIDFTCLAFWSYFFDVMST